MSEYEDLDAFIVAEQMRNEERESARRADEKAKEAWRADNIVIHDNLRQAVNLLEFEATVAEQRDRLSELPGFSQDQMEFRTFGWVPDNSEETRQAQSPRIRAVHGNAVLLSARWGGVNGNSSGERRHSEAIDTAFYSLGVAVEQTAEQGENVIFYHMAAPDVKNETTDSGRLYYGLTGGRFGSAISTYNTEMWSLMDPFTDAGIRASIHSGIPVPQVELDAYHERERQRAQVFADCRTRFESNMAKLSQEPYQSPHASATRGVTEQFLGRPAKDPLPLLRNVGRVVFLGRAWEKPEPEAPFYAPFMKPLVATNDDLLGLAGARTNLQRSFERYLLTDPVITKKYARY